MIKKRIRGREKARKIKPLIDLLIVVFSLLPKKFRAILFLSFRMLNGNKGLLIRYVLFRSLASRCGENVSIHPGVYIYKPDKLDVGMNVSIHPMCYIDAAGGIKIGNDVSIAHSVTVLSTTHNYENSTIPIKDQGVKYESTIISDNVWIGAKATVLSGTKLNSGSIIAANCVVTTDVPSDSISGGIPNRVLKNRI